MIFQLSNTMDDLVMFLQDIQLEHLADNFKNEEISLQQLVQMTDGELEQIGISKFGNRKTILNATRANFKSKNLMICCSGNASFLFCYG